MAAILSDLADAVEDVLGLESESENEQEDGVAPAAAAAAAPAAAPAREARSADAQPRTKKQIAVPKDSATFFRARAKDPKLFNFTPDGNLQVPEMRGQAPKVIELPFYRPSTSEERLIEEQRRYEQIKDVEKEYDENLHSLKDAMIIWRDTGAASDALKFQRELTRLDALRTQLRSPVRWTVENKRVQIRKVLLDKVNEDKRLKYPVYTLNLRSFYFEELVKVGKVAEPVLEDVAEASEGQPQGETFILISTPDDARYGALSPDTMVDFVFNSTMYNGLVQAYELERVTRLGRRKDIGPLLLKSRSPGTIRILAQKVSGDVENPRNLWIEIMRALVAQHPRYADILKSTGDATLVYTNHKEKSLPKERRWGVGLTVEDPATMVRASWEGPNTLGQAWQVVRDSLPAATVPGEEDAPAPLQGGSYNESGKTLADAKKQRSGVLSGYYRKKSVRF
jgi:predicted NAD-dependent protein-ADP-ribosyltransferase YbiA (DUF1768 family)